MSSEFEESPYGIVAQLLKKPVDELRDWSVTATASFAADLSARQVLRLVRRNADLVSLKCCQLPPRSGGNSDPSGTPPRPSTGPARRRRTAGGRVSFALARWQQRLGAVRLHDVGREGASG